MGKQKTTTSSTQSQQYTGQTKNDYGWMNTPINEQMQGVIDAANRETGPDPAIANRFAMMEEDVRRSKMDPMGAYTTPFVRERAQLSQLLSLGSQRDKAMREDSYNREQGKFTKLLAAANMTAPRMVQTGGSTSGNSTSTGSGTATAGKDLFGTILDGVGMGAAM